VIIILYAYFAFRSALNYKISFDYP